MYLQLNSSSSDLPVMLTMFFESTKICQPFLDIVSKMFGIQQCERFLYKLFVSHYREILEFDSIFARKLTHAMGVAECLCDVRCQDECQTNRNMSELFILSLQRKPKLTAGTVMQDLLQSVGKLNTMPTMKKYYAIHILLKFDLRLEMAQQSMILQILLAEYDKIIQGNRDSIVFWPSMMTILKYLWKKKSSVWSLKNEIQKITCECVLKSMVGYDFNSPERLGFLKNVVSDPEGLELISNSSWLDIAIKSNASEMVILCIYTVLIQSATNSCRVLELILFEREDFESQKILTRLILEFGIKGEIPDAFVTKMIHLYLNAVEEIGSTSIAWQYWTKLTLLQVLLFKLLLNSKEMAKTPCLGESILEVSNSQGEEENQNVARATADCLLLILDMNISNTKFDMKSLDSTRDPLVLGLECIKATKYLEGNRNFLEVYRALLIALSSPLLTIDHKNEAVVLSSITMAFQNLVGSTAAKFHYFNCYYLTRAALRLVSTMGIDISKLERVLDGEESGLQEKEVVGQISKALWARICK